MDGERAPGAGETAERVIVEARRVDQDLAVLAVVAVGLDAVGGHVAPGVEREARPSLRGRAVEPVDGRARASRAVAGPGVERVGLGRREELRGRVVGVGQSEVVGRRAAAEIDRQLRQPRDGIVGVARALAVAVGARRAPAELVIDVGGENPDARGGAVLAYDEGLARLRPRRSLACCRQK